MHTIAKIRSGSTLYGIDSDAAPFKCVHIFIPNVDEIIMGTVRTPAAPKKKDRVQQTNLPLTLFLKLAGAGDPIAIDALFSPPEAFIDEPTQEWKDLVANRHHLMTVAAIPFFRSNLQHTSQYTNAIITTFASQYGNAVITAFKSVLALANQGAAVHGGNAPIAVEVEAIRSLCENTANMSLVDEPHDAPFSRWNVYGKSFPFTQAFDAVIAAAEEALNVRYKPWPPSETPKHCSWISGALTEIERCAQLQRSGHLTFPLANAESIRAIAGEGLGFNALGDVVDAVTNDYLAAISTGKVISQLPHAADKTWVRDFILETYKREIKAHP